MTLFSNQIFEQIEQHTSHSLTVTTYQGSGGIANIAIECRDCEQVVHDIEPEPANSISSRGDPTGEDPDGAVDVASGTTELTKPDRPISNGDTTAAVSDKNP